MSAAVRCWWPGVPIPSWRPRSPRACAPARSTGGGNGFPTGSCARPSGCVRDRDVYLLAPTGPPVNDNLVELMLLLDACRRGGAARCTAVVPYLGYARQDRRSQQGQALGLRTVADALAAAGADRLVVVDPHSRAVEAAFSVPVLTLTAVPVLAAAAGAGPPHPQVVVAPDLGAVKLAEHYAALLGLPVAVVRKSRLTGATVAAEDLVGAVTGLAPLVVDDMISTAGTVEAAVQLALRVRRATGGHRRGHARVVRRAGGRPARAAADPSAAGHRQPPAGRSPRCPA